MMNVDYNDDNDNENDNIAISNDNNIISDDGNIINDDNDSNEYDNINIKTMVTVITTIKNLKSRIKRKCNHELLHAEPEESRRTPERRTFTVAIVKLKIPSSTLQLLSAQNTI